MRKLAKRVRMNFFRTLEINHRLAEVWEILIQEKWQNLSKNDGLCGILFSPSPIYYDSFGK